MSRKTTLINLCRNAASTNDEIPEAVFGTKRALGRVDHFFPLVHFFPVFQLDQQREGGKQRDEKTSNLLVRALRIIIIS